MRSDIGRSTWFDIPVTNLSDAMSFYEGLLGWSYKQMEGSCLPDYVMIEAGGSLIGGLRKIPASALAKAGPVLYFTVEKLEPKILRAKELGAEIIGDSVDVGRERGRYQWIRDREGNLIGLWAPD
jgi:predicted enzyme related to lactoylglutathione lyase